MQSHFEGGHAGRLLQALQEGLRTALGRTQSEVRKQGLEVEEEDETIHQTAFTRVEEGQEAGLQEGSQQMQEVSVSSSLSTEVVQVTVSCVTVRTPVYIYTGVILILGHAPGLLTSMVWRYRSRLSR
mmetsp:Transcript_152332/g.280748  ORF Transcript_152332/g.280748 Transcript_152332/m.280748 type:complete len:127 (+) Transcript_152332:63-443(+)